MIVISIMAVLLVVLAVCALRVRLTTDDAVVRTSERPGVLVAAFGSKAPGVALDGSLGSGKADPRAKARRRAVRRARRVNHRGKDSPRKRRRRRSTGSKHKHGRPRGR
jgi:hypothetical protein